MKAERGYDMVCIIPTTELLACFKESIKEKGRFKVAGSSQGSGGRTHMLLSWGNTGTRAHIIVLWIEPDE